MRMRLPFSVVAASVLLGMSARAEDVRFPETGSPALVVHTPDGWTHQPDGDGNMLLIAGNHTASFALTVGSYVGTLDDLAAATMRTAQANPPQNMGPTQISGYRGYMYDTNMVNPSGIHVNVHMVVVKTDASHMASITLLSVDGIGGGDYAAARGAGRRGGRRREIGLPLRFQRILPTEDSRRAVNPPLSYAVVR